MSFMTSNIQQKVTRQNNKQENVTYIKENKQSIETEPKMTEKLQIKC